MIFERVETDVLCVGGGIASLMAAIRASELGARVMVVDKSNTLHSGSGGLGNDHFMCYIPEIHGQDIKPIVNAVQNSLVGGMKHVEFLYNWLEATFDIVKLWDSWGIPMKYEGRYEFAGHALPERPLISLHYNGQNQKAVLTREALKRGVDILNRVMVFDLLCENKRITGALGIGTREDKMVEFRAKSVVLATGRCIRLYPSPVAGSMFNVAYAPSVTGDGQAMAYRAGAALANLEMPGRWAGPKYFARCGKATWIGVLRDPQGNPVGPFIARPERKYGDATSDIYPTLFEDYVKSGRGPVYMDCRGITEEDYKYMLHFLKHEGLSSLLDYLDEEKIDLRKNPVEFGTYEIMPKGGIYHDQWCQASVKGLFSAGDESYCSSGISMASTYGWISGENAVKYAREAEHPDIKPENDSIHSKKKMLEQIRNRKAGADWKEANIALQQIMNDYAGANRSQTLLDAGLEYLRRLRRKVGSLLMAANQHELMRCLEVLDLLEIGEAVFITAQERKETRGLHVRADYPFTNPLLEKFLLISKTDERPVIEWQEIRR